MPAATYFRSALCSTRWLPDGERLPGKAPLSIASAIVEKEPAPITTIVPATPAAVEHVILRCLAKDPEERWQAASDVAWELEWLADHGNSSASIVPQYTARNRTWLPWVVCGVLGASLLAGVFAWRYRSNARQASYFLAVLPFTAHDMALAPNGHTVAVVGFSAAEKTNCFVALRSGRQRGKKAGGNGRSEFSRSGLLMAKRWRFSRRAS